MLSIPERIVMELVTPPELPDLDTAEVETALTNELDMATAHLPDALVPGGLSIALRYALRFSALQLGFRRGYATGSAAAAWAVHGATRDTSKSGG